MNLSSMENHSPVPVSRGVVYADISLLFIGFLAGTFGNGRACLLLRKQRRDLRKSIHFLFASLSVIGLVSSLVSIFGWLVLVVISYVFDLNVPEVLCFIVTPLAFACIMLNAMTLSLMAIDRQDCVLRPYHQRITPRNVKTVIALTWFIALVFTSVFVFFEAFAADPVCQNFDPYSLLEKLTSNNGFTVYVVAVAMVLNVATFLIIVITFIRIVKKLRSSLMPHSHAAQNRRELEITKLTYRSCAIFLIFWLPAFVCNLLARFGRGFDGTGIKAAQVLTVTIAKFTYALNPFLYNKLLKARRANQVFAMAALKSLAGVSHPACLEGAPLQEIAEFARELGSGAAERIELPSVLNGQTDSTHISITQPAATIANLAATICQEIPASQSDTS